MVVCSTLYALSFPLRSSGKLARCPEALQIHQLDAREIIFRQTHKQTQRKMKKKNLHQLPIKEEAKEKSFVCK